MARTAETVEDVILGEALAVSKGNVLGAYEDMLAIASVIANRAAQLGVPMKDVIGVTSEFNAYGKALPAGANKNAWMAQQALAEVMEKGPVHNATFYATPSAAKNLPEGLVPVASTRGHQYFSDPQNRAIYTAQGLVTPSAQPTEVAGMQTGTSTYDPRSAFMSAITPPNAAPSVIDKSFPSAPIPAGGPRRDFQVPAFMQGAFTGIGNAVRGAGNVVRDVAVGVRDAVMPARDAIDRPGSARGLPSAAPGWDPNFSGQGANKRSEQLGAAGRMPATVAAFNAAMSLFEKATGKPAPGVKDAIAKPGTSRDKNTRDSQHYHGTAFDLDVSKYNDREKQALVSSLQMAGFRGFGLGPTTLHADMREKGARWQYDENAKTWAGIPMADWEAALNNNSLPQQALNSMSAAIPMPAAAPRGGLVTAQELAAERQKMVDAYAPYQQSPVPRAAPVVAGTAGAGFGKSGSARGALSPAAVLAGQYGLYQPGLGINPGALMMDRPAVPTGRTGGGGGWKGAPMPSIPPAGGRPGAVVAGVRPSLPPAGMPAARAAPQPAVAGPAQSVGRQGYVSPAKEVERLVTSAGIPSLPSRRNDESMRFSPGRPAVQSVGRQNYVSPAKERERLVTSAGIPSLPTQPREATMSAPSRAPAKESVGRQNYVSPAKERERLVTSAGIPSLPTVSRETSRALPSAPVVGAGPADFRQSPGEARAQQLNEMHDKIVRDNPLPQRNLSKAEMVTAYGAYGNRAPAAPAVSRAAVAPSGIAMAADSVLNRQAAPASIAGVRAAPAAGPTKAASNSWADQVAAAKAKDPVGIPMQADKYLAQTVINNLPGLAAVARSAVPTIQRTIEKATAPRQAAPAVGPTTGAAQTGRMNYAEPKLIAPAPAAPSGNPNVVSTPTQGGGVRSVDTRTGWSSYTNPSTGVTTTFTPDGTPVGGGQGMVGGGGGGPGGK